MSDTFDSMLTPEQARMMYAAFLERLPESSVAAQSIARNVENPLDFVSVANRQPAQVAPVTQGVAAMPPPAEADLPPPRTTPVEQAAGADVSPTTPQSQADALTRLRELIGGGDRPSQADIGRDALTNFFFSMAASRNPSFFGQLGEAGQALTRTQAEARTAARQERQVDVEAAYRAAQEARQAAEVEWARDPQNPLNIARLAAARSDEVRARAALASAGRERLGQGYITRDRETGNYQIEYPAAPGGRQTRPFSGVPASVGAATRRAEQADIRMVEQAGRTAEQNFRAAARDSGRITDPTEIARGAAAAARVARQEAAARLGIDPAIAERFGGAPASQENVDIRRRNF